MSQSHWTSSGAITPNQTLGQTHTVMQALFLAIKSMADAKSHLCKKGWTFPGEEITLEILARTLFAAVVDKKITPSLANPILAVAYLITEKVKEHNTSNITSAITKHILDALCQEIGLVALCFSLNFYFLMFLCNFLLCFPY